MFYFFIFVLHFLVFFFLVFGVHFFKMKNKKQKVKNRLETKIGKKKENQNELPKNKKNKKEEKNKNGQWPLWDSEPIPLFTLIKGQHNFLETKPFIGFFLSRALIRIQDLTCSGTQANNFFNSRGLRRK